VFNPKEHYDELYFGGKKQYVVRLPDGTLETREYIGPGVFWDGFKPIVDTLLGLLHPSPESVIDIGCGGGCFLSYLRKAGIEDTLGVDISEHAVNNAVDGAGPLMELDVVDDNDLKKLEGKTYDMLTATDLLEHIFLEDLDKFLLTIRDLSNKWFFFDVCSEAFPDFGVSYSKDVEMNPDNSHFLISGHVNIQSFDWWVKKLSDYGIIPNFELMYRFQVYRTALDNFKELKHCQDSWHCKNVFICEKDTTGWSDR